MRLNRFLIGCCFGIATGCGVRAQTAEVYPSDTLSPQGRYEYYMNSVRNLDVRTLALLTQSDCRLADLESDCYRYYRLVNRRAVPADLQALIAQKRQAVDYRRSYIDSLYYLQALQALNAKTPDWELADKFIEQALTHNRFFVRAVLFRWTQLQRAAERTDDWTPCLAYARASLQPLGWQPKVRALGDALYVKILERLERLMREGLYQDAIALYEEMKRYLSDDLPLFFMPYREQNLLYTAYQGIFNSYYAVAEKAFARKLYQQAQRQALNAYDYYRRHETYMSGVNGSLLLLEKILLDYRQFMHYADEDEKAYYAAMIDTITGRTGLTVPPLTLEVIYDMDAELRMAEVASAKAEAELLAESTVVRPPVTDGGRIPVAQPVPEVVSTEGTPSEPLPEDRSQVTETSAASGASETALPVPESPVSIKQQKWTLAYAQKQWDYHVEQARLYRAKRQFIPAQEAYAMGDSIRRYYPVRTPVDFKSEIEANDLLCVEQLLNKAQYRLWQNDMAGSDSLYRKALTVVMQTDPERRAAFYSLVDGFEEQKKRLVCRQQRQTWDERMKEIRRQLAFGREEAVARLVAETESLLAADRTAETPCLSDTADLDGMRDKLRHLQTYRRLMDSADRFLVTGDSLAYIRCQLAADRYFDGQAMAAYVADATSLFARLSYGKRFPLMVWYVQACLEDGNEAEAEFVSSYLKTYNYTTPLLDQLRKKIKKGKGGS